MHDPSPVSLAVAAIGGPAIYYAAATKTIDWTRVVAVFVPTTGLLLGHTRLDRVLAVPLITLVLAYQHFTVDRWQAFLVPALACVGAVLTAAGKPCDAMAIVATDVASVLLTLYHVSRIQKRPSWAVLGSLGEAALVAFLLGADVADLRAREAHLTWWGIAGLGLFDYARAIGYGDSTCVVILALQVCVVAGVWIMSATSCDLLVDTYDDVGPGLYAVGNFAMHYWPSLRVLLYRPSTIVEPYRQVTIAVGVVAIYLATSNPKSIYGCDGWVTQPLVLVCFGILISLCGMFTVTLGSTLWLAGPKAV